MVVTRSLQLAVKKTARTQKTLEGQLLMVKDGERIAVSSRVAELDQIMPQYLGVSKAVLDNVIFCHQDESLWPMSEPGVLKKKFDEIFEALKYTKAVDNIKVLRKKQNEELGKYKITEQYAKEDKDKGEKVCAVVDNPANLANCIQAEKRSRELSDEIETLRTRTHDLGTELQTVSQQAKEAWDHYSQFQVILERLEQKRVEARTKEENVRELKEHVKQMTDSDEELRVLLDRYEERQGLYDREEGSQLKKYNNLMAEEQQVQGNIGKKQTEYGKFQAEQAHYERQIEHREALVKKTSRRHNIRGFDSELSNDQVGDFMERISKMSRDQNAIAEKARKDTQQELRTVQRGLSQLNEKKTALNQSKENARGQIALNDRKIASHQTNLIQINMDEGGKALLESNMEHAASRLQKSKAAFEAAAWEKQIQEADSHLRALDEKAERLNSELIQATNQAGETARLDFLKKSKKDSEKSLQTMRGAHGDRIGQIVGAEWQANELEGAFQAVLGRMTKEIKNAESQRDGTSRELEQMEFKLTTNRNELKRKLQEAGECQQKVRVALDDDEPAEFLETLRTVEANRDTTKGDVDNFSNLKTYYSDCLKNANENDICRLCERTFKLDKERTKFKAKLEKLMSNAAQQAYSEELAILESELKKMREASPSYDTWQRLCMVEIPGLEIEGQRLNPKRDALISELEEQDRIVQECTAAKRDVESISKTVYNITKYYNDITSYDSQIEDLSSKQSQSGLLRGLVELQDELKESSSVKKAVSETIIRLSADRDRARTEINTHDLELRDVKAKLGEASGALKEKNNIATQIEDLANSSKDQREIIFRADNDISALAGQISQFQANEDDITRRGDERDRELQEEASKLSDSVFELKKGDKEITSFTDRNGPHQLVRSKR